jgi:hypothetical protein
MTPSSITSPAYTPGPWYVSESSKPGFIIRSPRGGFVAWAGTGSLQRDAANAQLMAAAPRFLEYCKLLLPDVTHMAEDPHAVHDWNWTLTRMNLQSLIALAEGDPSLRRLHVVDATAA